MHEPDARPRLAFVVHQLYPFRLHIQRRVAREIPQFHLHTLVTWNQREHFWRFGEDREIGLEFLPDGVDEVPYNKQPIATRIKDWRAGRHLVRRLQDLRPAAVVMCGYAFPAHYRAIRWLRKTRTPYMLWSDSNLVGDTISGPRRTLKLSFVRPLVQDAVAVLPCGSLGIDYYARYGATPDKTFLCPVEPDYSLIENAPAALLDSVRARFNLAPDRKRFLVCARLIDLKRVDVSIDAFAAIAAQRPDWDLTIVGDGPCRATLEARVPPALRPRITFTGFIDDQPTTAAIERLCHVLVHPGSFEAWGVVILEAAAAGLAIVASSAVGAAADLVRDNVNGRIVPPADIPALKAALLNVTNPDTLATMQAASRQASLAFRTHADPVRGLRSALSHARILSP